MVGLHRRIHLLEQRNGCRNFKDKVTMFVICVMCSKLVSYSALEEVVNNACSVWKCENCLLCLDWVEIVDSGNPNLVMALAGNKADLIAKRKVEPEILKFHYPGSKRAVIGWCVVGIKQAHFDGHLFFLTMKIELSVSPLTLNLEKFEILAVLFSSCKELAFSSACYGHMKFLYPQMRSFEHNLLVSLGRLAQAGVCWTHHWVPNDIRSV
eukprot:Gb_34234 [translate_table: standard]